MRRPGCNRSRSRSLSASVRMWCTRSPSTPGSRRGRPPVARTTTSAAIALPSARSTEPVSAAIRSTGLLVRTVTSFAAHQAGSSSQRPSSPPVGEALLGQVWTLVGAGRLVTDEDDGAAEPAAAQRTRGRRGDVSGADDDEGLLAHVIHLASVPAGCVEDSLLVACRGVTRLGRHEDRALLGDLHRVGGLAAVLVLGLTGARVELPLVTGADHLPVEQRALAERALLVDADVVDGEHLVVDEEQGDGAAADIDLLALAAGEVLHLGDVHPGGAGLALVDAGRRGGGSGLAHEGSPVVVCGGAGRSRR